MRQVTSSVSSSNGIMVTLVGLEKLDPLRLGSSFHLENLSPNSFTMGVLDEVALVLVPKVAIGEGKKNLNYVPCNKRRFHVSNKIERLRYVQVIDVKKLDNEGQDLRLDVGHRMKVSYSSPIVNIMTCVKARVDLSPTQSPADSQMVWKEPNHQLCVSHTRVRKATAFNFV